MTAATRVTITADADDADRRNEAAEMNTDITTTAEQATRFDIRLQASGGPYYTRVLAPTPQRPFWHEEDDGTRIHFTRLKAAGEVSEQIAEAHGAAIAMIVRAAISADDHNDRRRLALAASRLAEEVTGLWTTP